MPPFTRPVSSEWKVLCSNLNTNNWPSKTITLLYCIVNFSHLDYDSGTLQVEYSVSYLLEFVDLYTQMFYISKSRNSLGNSTELDVLSKS